MGPKEHQAKGAKGKLEPSPSFKERPPAPTSTKDAKNPGRKQKEKPGQNAGKTKVVKRPPSSKRILSVAYKKAMEEERREQQSFCCATLRNIYVFIVLYAIILFARSFLATYFESILQHLHRRYLIRHLWLEFIVGVEKIGFIVTLIFSGYYGRNMHKPLAIFCGAMMCAIGAIICWIPYFIIEARENGDASNRTSSMMQYLDAGLCQSGRNDSTQYSTSQCNYIPAVHQENDAFSLLCLGKFLLGIGSALFITLGLVYVDEGTPEKDVPLLIGILLCMNGLGEMVAGLLAWCFSSYTENMADRIGYPEWDVGAWWLGLPLGAALFYLVSFVFLFFPKWLHTPRWLAVRRRRRLRRLEHFLVERDLKEKKRRQRQKRKRRQQRQAANEPVSEAQENGAVVNSNLAMSEEQIKDVEGAGSDDDDIIIEDDEDVPNLGANNIPDILTATSENGIVSHDSENGVVSHDSENGVVLHDSDSAIQQEQLEYISALPADPEGATSRSGKRVTIVDDKKTEEEEADEVFSVGGSSGSSGVKRQRSGTKLGRQLRDLPQNLGYLLKKPVYPLVVVGSGLAAYLPYAYRPTLPHFLDVQYPRLSPPHDTLVGVSHGLGTAFGAALGGFLVWILALPPGRRQMRLVLSCLATCVVLLLLLLAMRCDTPRYKQSVVDGETSRNSSSDIDISSNCNKACDCTGVERMPVCTHLRGVKVEFPSPCHAGCRKMSPGQHKHKYTLYSNCLCNPKQEVSTGLCGTSCETQPLFYVIYTLAVTAHAMSYVTIILFFLRLVSTKMRSLSLGFGVWLISVAAIPGVTIFKAIRSSMCLLSDKNCQEDDMCWFYDVSKFRYVTVGAVILFQVAALACFVATWYLQGSSKSSQNETEVEKSDQGKSLSENFGLPSRNSSKETGDKGADNMAFEHEVQPDKTIHGQNVGNMVSLNPCDTGSNRDSVESSFSSSDI